MRDSLMKEFVRHKKKIINLINLKMKTFNNRATIIIIIIIHLYRISILL